MEHKGDKVITISSFDERHGKIKDLFICPICKKLMREVTTIDECLHKFCRICIENKITEERLKNCPVCNVDMGVYPLQKLRADYGWQSLRRIIKFRRQKLTKNGVLQEKGKKLQTSKLEAEYEDSPSETLPVKGMEKSISSILNVKTATTRRSHTNGKRKLGGKKVFFPKSPCLSALPPIKETEDCYQTSTSHPNLRRRASGRKQTIIPSTKELSNDKKEKRTKQSEVSKNMFKPLDCMVGGVGTSDFNRSDMLQSTTPLTNGNKEKKDKAKRKELVSNGVDRHDEVPSGSKCSGNVPHVQEKRPGITEDLNVPAKKYLDNKIYDRSFQLWLALVPSNKQKSYMPLPQILPSCLMVKDLNMTASYIRKYLVKKLSLFKEEEVELSLCGRPISPDCPVKEMVDLWVQAKPISQTKSGIVGGSGMDFVMVVTYKIA